MFFNNLFLSKQLDQLSIFCFQKTLLDWVWCVFFLFSLIYFFSLNNLNRQLQHPFLTSSQSFFNKLSMRFISGIRWSTLVGILPVTRSSRTTSISQFIEENNNLTMGVVPQNDLQGSWFVICSPSESASMSLFNYYLHDYFLLLFIITFCLGLSGLLYFLAYLVSPKILSEEKSSGYECGYEPFEDARVPFSVQFYLVSILFLIFDIEVAFLFPYGVVFSTLYLNGILIFFLFLLILALGFVFEYKKKAINW